MQSQQQFSGRASGVPVPACAGFFDPYQPAGGEFDELRGPQAQRTATSLRPSWPNFCNQLAQLGREGLTHRWNRSQRLIYENGISYSPYGDPHASGRQWQLDALPLLFSEQDWQTLAGGITQRAELLQLVLADLLGPQKLLADKVLPPELVLGHPNYQLPYAHLQPAGDSYLHFYATDLGRSADGQWWVMGDRTEAPSGIGFALENRIVVSRMLPEIFRRSQVKRLAPFFMAMQQKLQTAAQTNSENPRVALLSRGPAHKNYFEDAYLARYLGYTLVEGADLTVRDQQVWLKTLDGLQPVDVLLRRPNSEDCDPLEFSGNSSLGPSGLLQAALHDNVTISNPLGSGLVESPAFMAFMPRLSKYFLQTDLSLPGLATWWLGEPRSLEHALKHLDSLVISPAFRKRGQSIQAIRELNRLARPDLEARLRAKPRDYVAQERMNCSTAPSWSDGELVAQRVVLRAFAVADDNSYAVMEGALARTSPLEGEDDIVIPVGEGSKDTWILSEQPVEQVTLLSPKDEHVVLRRSGADLPSRVADNIYWLGRQIERASYSARLLRTVILRMTSESADGTLAELPALLRVMAEQGQIEPGYAVTEIQLRLPQLEQSLPQAVFDAEQAGSLRSVIDELFRLASHVRDRISIDTWRVIVRIDQTFRAPVGDESFDLSDVLGLINRLIVDLAAIEGFVMESMTRSHVFRFLELGRRLERAHQTTVLVRCAFVDTHELSSELLEAVLQIADSLMTYRSRYLANLQLAAVLDLLLADLTNPRSIAFQLESLQREIEELPRDPHLPELSSHRRLAMDLIHEVRMVEVQSLADQYRQGEIEPLKDLLVQIEDELPQLSNEIWRHYLVHAGTPRKLSATSPEQSE